MTRSTPWNRLGDTTTVSPLTGRRGSGWVLVAKRTDTVVCALRRDGAS
jgi:hypothetical protein